MFYIIYVCFSQFDFSDRPVAVSSRVPTEENSSSVSLFLINIQEEMVH